MNAMLDTLKASKAFEDAGFAKAQADTLAITIAEAMSDTREDLVTKDFLRGELATLRGELKDDTAALRSELKGDMAALRSELKGDMAALRSDLTGDAASLRSDLTGDAASLRSDLTGETAALRSDLKNDIASLRLEIAGVKNELIRWVLASQVMLIVILVALTNFTKLFD